jgi:hypothetical protein
MLSKTGALLLAMSFVLAGLPADAQGSASAQRGRRIGDPNEFYKAPSTMRGKTVLIPTGTTWEGRIDTTVSSEKSHPGQNFKIIMSAPVLANGTDVVVPAGSALIGEVVEATPANKVYRQKWESKILIRGKLRVQVSGLQTPDGTTYPLVAHITGEVSKHHRPFKKPLGNGVAYIGTAASFEAVHPGASNRKKTARRPGEGPKAISKRELLEDELHGLGAERWNEDQDNTIRSLVLKKRDYYIYEGSPLTVKLVAPFRIGITQPGMGAPMTVDDAPVDDALPPASARGDAGAPPLDDASFDGGGSRPTATAPTGGGQPGAPSADSF